MFKNFNGPLVVKTVLLTVKNEAVLEVQKITIMPTEK